MSKPSDQPSGQPIGGQWARQQKQGMAKQETTKQDQAANPQDTHRQLSDEEQRKLEQDSDDDSPRNAGGAGNPQASPLEPEKQGGIGGP
jgi:hypothetical protein